MFMCRLTRVACWLGLTVVALSFATIGFAIAANPWFNLFRNALSDMGRVGLETAYVFNIGLLITSFAGMGYAYCLANIFRRRISVFLAGIYFVAAVFLMLIALFPEGTSPHGVVSYEFFLFMDVVMLFYGVSLWAEGFRTRGLLSAVLTIIALAGSVLIDWPSVALVELYNIAIYSLWYVMMFSVTTSLLKCSGK